MTNINYHSPFTVATVYTFRLEQNCHEFADDSFTFIFWNEKKVFLIKFQLKIVTKGLIDNKLILVQVMARCQKVTFRLEQNCHDFADDSCTFIMFIFWNEKKFFLTKFHSDFFTKRLIDNKSILVQVLAWCQKGNKSLHEPMLIMFHDVLWSQ